MFGSIFGYGLSKLKMVNKHGMFSKDFNVGRDSKNYYIRISFCK